MGVLDELREIQKRNNLPTSYDRLCRNIPAETAAQRVAAGDAQAVRECIDRYGGLSINMPKYALFFMLFTMASGVCIS